MSSHAEKIEKIKADLKKARRKKKFKDMRESKKEMLKEMKESNASGFELSTHT